MDIRTPRARYIEAPVVVDLESAMVFIGGPRQVGKTIFSLGLLDEPSVRHPAYLNWDDMASRSELLEGRLPPDQPLIILDEIHKFAGWRNLVKGFYDTRKGEQNFIVTGSARLDYYSKGGDSLQGRYHYYRLHPFTFPEISSGAHSDLEQLLEFGGFPEPLLRAQSRFWRRWQRERGHRVIREDVRDLENVKEISLLELMAAELPNRVGSPLSVKKLADLLNVAHATAARWLMIFERMYFCFLVPPFGARRTRAVRKEQKLYLWDWSLVPEKGPRFENLVASHLLKYCHFTEDTEGFRMDLRFFRDVDRREVDFIVLKDDEPLFAVECKTGERNVSNALFYLKERTSIPRFYQVHLGKANYEKRGVRVLPFSVFCEEVGLV